VEENIDLLISHNSLALSLSLSFFLSLSLYLYLSPFAFRSLFLPVFWWNKVMASFVAPEPVWCEVQSGGCCQPVVCDEL
jgi:hypothetical protein